MATAFDGYAPFDDGAGADVMEDRWREMMRAVRASAVMWFVDNELEVFADSTGMQVKVKSGQLWARGHWGKVTSQKTLSIAAAHATLVRLDTVVARVNFVDNRVELDVLTGTAGSGVPLAITSNTAMEEIELAIITVGAAVSTITAGSVADRRLRQGTLTSIHRYRQTNVQSIPNNAFQRVLFDLAVDANGDITAATVSGGTEFTFKRRGWWKIDARLRYGFDATSGHRELIIATDPTVARPADAGCVTTGSPGFFTSDSALKSAGDKVSIWAFQAIGGSLNTVASSQEVSVTFTWLGV